MYQPTVGRWLSRDPIGVRGQAEIVYSHAYVANRLRGQLKPTIRPHSNPNLYAYSWNDPVNLIDPSGLIAIQQGGGQAGMAGRFLPVKVFATAAFGLPLAKHLCIEATVYSKCGPCAKPSDPTTYQIELLGYNGDGRAPKSARKGGGPSGLGFSIKDRSNKETLLGPGIKKAWGIFVVKGGKCKAAKDRIQGVAVRFTVDPKTKTARVGSTVEQCELASCLKDEAEKVAKKAEVVKALYDIK